MSIPNPPKLHIVNALFGAFWIVWHQRLAFLRALAVPIAFMVALMVAWRETYESVHGELAWLVWVGYCFLFVLFAVRCHRIVLLAQFVGTAWTLPAWTWRETRFACWTLAAWLVSSLAYMLVTMLIDIIIAPIHSDAEAGSTPHEIGYYVRYATTAIYWYFFARFCLLLPAIAIDRKANLQHAWQWSRGNGLRLYAVICLAPYLISLATSYLYRENATLIEYLLLMALWCVFLAVEIAALSLSYKQLAPAEIDHA